MKNLLPLIKNYFIKNSPNNTLIANSYGPLSLYGGVYGQGDYTDYAKKGYESNVIVYRCINVIARALASVPLILYKQDYDHKTLAGEHELKTHPLLDLLMMPSPMQAGSAFFEEAISYLLLSGNLYVQVLTNDVGVPVRLCLHRPDAVHVVEGGFRVTKTGSQESVHPERYFVEKDPITEQSALLHIKLFNPMKGPYGLSPMAAATGAIEQHNAVGGHNLALLQNGGRPSGALTLKNPPNSLGLNETQRQTLRSDLKRVLEGRDNAGRIMILEGDFAWQEMGMTPKDLDFVEGKNMSAREICQAFGVPPMLAGVPGDATFANYREARFHLWEDTILPLLDVVVAELNGWLLPYYGDDLRLGYDLDNIQALAPKREMAWAKIAAADFLTLNEKREAVGYGPIEGGDVLSREAQATL